MQIIPDVSRTKEIIKIRAESNKTESRGARENEQVKICSQEILIKSIQCFKKGKSQTNKKYSLYIFDKGLYL